MNPFLTRIQEQIQNSQLIEQDKQALLKSLAEADKQWTITDFKLDRTEKVKKTTAILLEETIEELEKKRQAVEAQNRELEIETALEKVRAVAMGMNKSEDLLDICESLFSEFRNLGFDSLRNTMINIHDDEHSSFVNYDYSDEIGKSITPLVYDIHPVIEKQIREIRSADDAFSETVFTGKDLEDWKKFRKERGEKDDPRIDDVNGLHYYFYSIGNGSIGISTFAPIDSDKLELLKRFRNVFILAYQRYNDIAQAAAQAREAQIQLALERVRASTMAMQRSEELIEAANLMFQQIEALGVVSWNCGFNIWDEDKKYATSWNGAKAGFSQRFKTCSSEDVFLHFYEAAQRGDDLYVEEIGGEACAAHYRYMATLPLVGDLLKDFVAAGIALPSFQIFHIAYFAQGYLMFITYEPVPQLWDIFKRFAKVFEQTYTRFLDLQKAEAQVREAKIEAALERTRTQSMLMQHSNELDNTLRVFHEQVLLLGIQSAFSFLWLPDEDKDLHIFWAAWAEDVPNDPLEKKVSAVFKSKAINYPLDRNEPATAQCLIDWKSKEPVVSYHVPPTGVESYFAAWQELIAGVEQLKPEYFSDGLYYVEAFMKYGCFGVMVTTDLREDEKNILARFAIEFERTYTRFLDLQKAEAQARESQIQLAMERVRARTMAMQRSEELPEVAALLFQQVKTLGVPQFHCGFNIFEIDDKECIWYPGSADGDILPPCKIPLTEHPVFMAFNESRKRGDELFVYEKEGEYQAGHYRYMLSLPVLGEILQNMLDAGIPFPTFQIDHLANFSHGNLLFITSEHFPEMHDTFKRFAKVFEQTYTRFLDLQKAEAQAREAKIEAALERVRSRTMAMHNSEDVGNTVATMFDELVKLGVETLRCGIGILHDKEPMEVWTAKSNPNGEKALIIGRLDMTVHPLLQGIKNSWQGKQSSFSYEMVGEDLKNYYRAINSLPDYPVRFDIESLPPKQVHTDFFFPEGALFAFTSEPIPVHHAQIFKRFAGVFGQTYRRYLDLLRAEAQARESQIQLAMERVRARTMAMQRSEELPEAASLLFKQLQVLDIPLFTCSFNIWDDDKKASTCWGAREDGLAPPFKTSSKEDVFIHILEAAQRGESLFVKEQGGEELEAHYRYLVSIPEVKTIAEELLKAGLSWPNFQIIHCAFFSHGYLLFISYKPVPEAHDIFKRFAKVFEQTYIRFLDLQKAEAQAREAQIEAALERVRSRSMAMQKSEELEEVIQVVFEQFGHLNINIGHTGFVIDYKARDDYEIWVADPLGVPAKVTIPYFDSVYYNRFNEAKEKGEDFFATKLTFEEKNRFYQKLFEYIPGLTEEAKAFYFSCPGLAASTVLLDNIGLYIENFSGIPYSDEENTTLMRFGKVFQQTYTRFLDLQTAEEQARESQIQLAMERVRARTMAMQHSDELPEAAQLLFQQVESLGIPAWSTGYCIWEEDKKAVTAWMSSKGVLLPSFRAPLTEEATFIHMREAWERGESFFVDEISGEAIKTHYEYMATHPSMDKIFKPVLESGFQLPTFQINHIAYYSQGFLSFITYERVPQAHDIFKRFAKVFEQTYTRFLDLQKAEAQAREAKVEAALERVRARTMAMQRSSELAEVATVLFQQVKALGIHSWLCGFSIWEIGDKEFTWYPGSPDGDILPPCKISLTEHPVFISFDESRKRGDELFVYEKGGEFQAEHYRYMLSVPGLRGLLQNMLDAGLSFPTFQIDHLANFSHGNLAFITYEHVPEMHDIFKRFAKVFDQTYTRFLDLKKAEALAKEALKQASLDRVRGQVASMRSAVDLEHIIPLLWHEFGSLDIPFIRCGVFIMNEAESIVNVYLSSPDGKSLGLLHLPFDTGGVTQNAVEHWRKKKVYKEHWNKEEFIAWTQTLIAAGQVHDAASYQGATAPPESLYLHFVPFNQGMLYVGSAEALHQENIELIKTLASTFSIAYSRYEDFRLLENAKNRIETTLVELKATQSQLVQSEKMASLGELTAGIAHEIQNPLNFVNNFSELSNELIEEMEQEMEKGNKEEVNAIIGDLRSNLEKINQHGRRADSIVKGMLQHSRASSGEKEATDINALADEYLRLAYHGFRAKDKSFNAILETDLDQSIGKIKAVPQELGRVLLNLYNNAFYAVNEKAGTPGYDPKIRLSTTKQGNTILIAVQDNGKGIPDKVKEKIFQPFFTTKPTGQGTGLGLSLSYDIVKSHGGEFRVDSKEGEGTSFVIQLPV